MTVCIVLWIEPVSRSSVARIASVMTAMSTAYSAVVCPDSPSPAPCAMGTA